MRELLIPVQKQLYAPKTRLFRLELKAPFYSLRWLRGRFKRGGRPVLGLRVGVGDFGGHFVARDS